MCAGMLLACDRETPGKLIKAIFRIFQKEKGRLSIVRKADLGSAYFRLTRKVILKREEDG